MLRRTAVALGIAVFVLALGGGVSAQEGSGIDWQKGPAIGRLGNVAEIQVPEGYLFSGKEGTQRFLALTQNPTNGNELGVLVPDRNDESGHWFVIFEYHDTGYVKDDEKDQLDADAILESLKEGTEAANDLRKERGWELFHVTGWEKAPFYDTRTNNLTWAIRGRSSGGQEVSESVNYSVRVLGRGGTMNVDLVLSPTMVVATVPEFEQLMGGFDYVKGQTYAEWVPGDKVAAYGLTALIAGGASAAALKSGLLQKFWKLIVAGFVALLAGLRKLFQMMKRAASPERSPTEDTVRG